MRIGAEAKELLGGFPINLVSVHDPDEYLAAKDAKNAKADILGAYKANFVRERIEGCGRDAHRRGDIPASRA